jgi:hypothetical protein
VLVRVFFSSPFTPRLRKYKGGANANFPDRKAIAATNWPERNVCIYFQDLSNNIREAFQTGQNPGKWQITPNHIGINDAKQGTALAVISRYSGLEVRPVCHRSVLPSELIELDTSLLYQ